MKRLVTMILLFTFIFASSTFACATEGSPAEAHFDGIRMVGEEEPEYTEESGFSIILLYEDKSTEIAQYLSTDKPLYASYLFNEHLWEYAPDGMVLDGLYEDEACTKKFSWGSAVGTKKRLYARFR